MATPQLSKEQLSALDAALKNIATAPPPANAIAAADLGQGAKEEFCTIWPKAEPILKIIGKYIGFIPGVGAAAGPIINGLVDGGDAISNAVCPKT